MPYKKTQRPIVKRVILIAGIALTAVALVAAGLGIYFAYQREEAAKEAAALEALPRIEIPEGHFAQASFEPATLPNAVKSLTIKPGADFLKSADPTEETLAKEIDAIMAELQKMEFNSLVVDTRLNDSVIFSSSKLKSAPIDALSAIIAKATELNIPVSAKFHMTDVAKADGTVITNHMDAANRRIISAAAAELAKKYEIANILLDSYYTEPNGDTYSAYVSYGSPGDYKDFMRYATNSAFDETILEIKQTKTALPVGILINDVWANQDTIEGGSATQADFEAYKDGYTDTKALIEAGMFDFVNVSISTALPDEKEPFKAIVQFWAETCKAKTVPMYVTLAGENAASKELPGWNGTDELARQLITAISTGNFYGFSITGLEHLKQDVGGSTEYLLKFLRDEISDAEATSGLDITSPTKKNVVTYEELYQFRMKFDPNADVFLNGEKIVPSERGGASMWMPLKVGKNTFTLEHKGRSTTYTIERKVIIIPKDEISPTGNIKVPGGGTVTVSVMAYKDSVITATLNGKTITLEPGGGSSEIDTSYVSYTGSFTAPKATNKEQNIGSITLKGTYQGYVENHTAANVTVDKLPDDSEPDALTGSTQRMAEVSLTYANTYPYQTTGGYPQAIPYQLPKGTKDIVVGQSGEYLHLRSGKTIMANAANVSDMTFDGNNAITQFSMGVENNDTVLRMTMNWRSPFSLTPSPYPTEPLAGNSYRFNANTITLTMDYVTFISPEGISGDISGSSVFSGISYEKVYNEARKIYQMKITLPMYQAGRYYGAHATWEDNTLVVKFNQPPSSGSLSGLRIVVDPGHGGNDNGTMAGRDILEKDANVLVAQAVRDALQGMGAEVIMTRESDVRVQNELRPEVAHSYQADMFLSIHHNSSAVNPNAWGVQTYYNSPFSQPLAMYIQEQTQQVTGTSTWTKWFGSMPSYNFIVTRERQFPSVLIETGFLSNVGDEAKSLDPSFRASFAQAVAQGVLNYYGG